MADIMHDEKLLMHFFQNIAWESLYQVGIWGWITHKFEAERILYMLFIKQYKFNIGMTPNKSSLLVLEKGSSW
jgi:hypothetical protein